jgi:hypothetical protein
MLIDLKPLYESKALPVWKAKFKKMVDQEERHPSGQKNYYLMYDLDKDKFLIVFELTANFNQICLQTAVIPSKKDPKHEKEIKDYVFD